MTDSTQKALELAEKGRTAYQIQLGQSYLTGRDFDGNDFPQDYSEAMRWLKRANDQGAFTATYLLGTMYEEGKGVPVDVPAAIELYEQSVERGAYLPCVNLARIYAQGTGSASVEVARRELVSEGLVLQRRGRRHRRDGGSARVLGSKVSARR